LNQKRIVCIGTVTIDRTYQVSEVVKTDGAMLCDGFKESWGGKGLNQTIAVNRSGIKPVFYAKVGSRDYQPLIQFLSEQGIDAKNISTVDSYTNHGVIQVVPDGRTAIIGVANPEVSFSRKEVDEILRTLATGDIVMLQNETDDIPYIISAAHERGCLVALNPSPFSEEIRSWCFDKVDFLFLNSREGQQISGGYEPDDICRFFLCKNPVSSVVLTLGEQGCLFMSREKKVFQPSFQVKVIDSIGAGDTFMGYFLGLVCQGRSVEESLCYAAKASAIVVGRLGAADAIPEMNEVIQSAISEKMRIL
jgi:ribokinase